MSNQIIVPALGESVTEATVSRWLKQVGERVDSDEPLVELETDKVNVEVPSPLSGTLSSIKVKEGRQDKMPFTMNMRNARATDLHHVLHYRDAIRFIQRHRRELRYSDIETNASTYQTFNLGISSGYSATAMGMRVKVNGIQQTNKTKDYEPYVCRSNCN